MSSELEKIDRDLSEVRSGAKSSTIDTKRSRPKVGEWYWVKSDQKDWLGCVTHIGSNYIKITSVGDHHQRIHASEILAICRPEPNHKEYIGGRVEYYRTEVHRLTSEVKELTACLGLAPVSLSDGGGVAALAVRSGGNEVAEYKTALVKAKETTLPELFEQIKSANAGMALWLKAETIPLKTQAGELNDLIKSVETRIFNVELYAGLTETVTKISDGSPASIDEKVRLMQRRAYMDEECLAEYEHGGMDFKSVAEFDEWIARPANRDRLLPFPRCIIAFRIRRNTKERECVTLGDFITIRAEEGEDKKTFLYVRNGNRLYCLSTAIDFGPRLFPDLDSGVADNSPKYAMMFADDVRDVISEAAYRGIVEEERKDERERKEKMKTCKKSEQWQYEYHGRRESRDYVKFSPDTVYFDDIEKYLQDEIDAHNRLVVILQGLMDRSDVFHPHPKFSLWKAEDFSSAFELVYDDSRALSVGDKPDFEAFRAMLNASLKAGCVTVGQDKAWTIREAERENSRLDNDWRCAKQQYRHTTFRPYGNPGPGLLAAVAEHSPRSGKCTYKWSRERRTYSYWDDKKGPINCTLTVLPSEILNVTAYKPGMFKQFYNDPRTRAEYLQWAPLLLAAEEYHAGNKTGKPTMKH